MKVETYKFRHKIFDFITNFQRKFVITHWVGVVQN